MRLRSWFFLGVGYLAGSQAGRERLEGLKETVLGFADSDVLAAAVDRARDALVGDTSGRRAEVDDDDSEYDDDVRDEDVDEEDDEDEDDGEVDDDDDDDDDGEYHDDEDAVEDEDEEPRRRRR